MTCKLMNTRHWVFNLAFMPPNMPPNCSCDLRLQLIPATCNRHPTPYEYRGAAHKGKRPVVKLSVVEIFTPYPLMHTRKHISKFNMSTIINRDTTHCLKKLQIFFDCNLFKHNRCKPRIIYGYTPLCLLITRKKLGSWRPQWITLGSTLEFSAPDKATSPAIKPDQAVSRLPS